MQNFRTLAQKLLICSPPPRNGDRIWDSPFSFKKLRLKKYWISGTTLFEAQHFLTIPTKNDHDFSIFLPLAIGAYSEQFYLFKNVAG